LGAASLDTRATREFVDAIGDKHLTREFRLQEADNFADAVRRVQQYNSDMRNSTIRRLDSEEAVKQEERLCTMEKVMQKLGNGQNELRAEQATREAVLLKSMKEVLEGILKEQTDSKPPIDNTYRESYGSRPFYCFSCGLPGHTARFCKRTKPASQFNTTPGQGYPASGKAKGFSNSLYWTPPNQPWGQQQTAPQVLRLLLVP
jgi:hypothetical protein